MATAFVLALVTFATFTSTSAWSFLRFLGALLVLVYIPGKVVLDRAKVALSPLEDLTLSLALGMVVSSAIYWALGLSRLGRLFWLFPILAAVCWLRRLPSRRVSANRSHVALVALLVLGAFPMTFVPVLFRNFDRLPDGGMTYGPLPDLILHASYANALTLSVPPQAPYLPGRTLSYHYGMDVLVALLMDAGGLSVLDLSVRFVPTFLTSLLILAGFCFSRAWLGSAWGALAATLLAVFGEDLSWLPGLLRQADVLWSVYFFGMPTVPPLFGINAMLPALGVMFVAFFCLLRLCREGGTSWLVLAAVFTAALFEYKVFSAAHVLLALGLTGAAYLVAFRDARLLRLVALSGALVAPLALYTLGGNSRVVMRLHPWPYVPAALVRSGLQDTWLGHATDALFLGGSVTPETLGAFLGLAVPLYVGGTCGMRLLALPLLARALLRPVPEGAMRFFLAAFVLSGPVLSLTLAVTPLSPNPELEYNNAVWFFLQSKYVAWVFVVEQLALMGRTQGGVARALALGAVLVLSVPSTVQYFVYRFSHEQLRRLGPNELELVDFVTQHTHAGAVILARPEVAEALIAMTRCRAPVFSIFPIYAASAAELQEHEGRLADFWASWQRGTPSSEALRAYRASYVVVDKEQDAAGPGARAVDRAGTLTRRFENGRYVVYAVSGTAGSDP